MPFFEKYKLRVFTLILFFIAASVSSFAESDGGLDVFDHSDPLYASFQQPDTAGLPKATLPAAPAETRLLHPVRARLPGRLDRGFQWRSGCPGTRPAGNAAPA